MESLFAFSQGLFDAMPSHRIPNGTLQSVTGQSAFHQIILRTVQQGFFRHKIIVEPCQHNHGRLVGLRSHAHQGFHALAVR